MHYVELKCQIGALWNKSQKCKLNDIKVQLWWFGIYLIYFLNLLFNSFVLFQFDDFISVQLLVTMFEVVLKDLQWDHILCRSVTGKLYSFEIATFGCSYILHMSPATCSLWGCSCVRWPDCMEQDVILGTWQYVSLYLQSVWVDWVVKSAVKWCSYPGLPTGYWQQKVGL